ncbi:MAG: type II secretion system protein F, partial [Clostridiales bacterium]|nr:type II secretion system protein F [Clostridiales bacterium]
MDYSTYRLTPKEWGKCIGLAALITALIAFLFYSSVWGIIFFPFLAVFLYKREKKKGAQRVQDELAGQFLDALRTVSASLMAGMSME